MALAMVALGSCGGPAAVVHIVPTSGTPSVELELCNSATGDCSPGQSILFESGAAVTIAVDNPYNDATTLVQLTVSGGSGGTYCQYVPINLPASAAITIGVGACGLTSTAGTPAGCHLQGSMPDCAAANNCGPTSTLEVCDGNGSMTSAQCCPAGFTCRLTGGMTGTCVH
jgi:hypothetical protein